MIVITHQFHYGMRARVQLFMGFIRNGSNLGKVSETRMYVLPLLLLWIGQLGTSRIRVLNLVLICFSLVGS